MSETGKPMTTRPLADAFETLRDDLATGEMPVEEVEHRLTLLADQARGAEPVARAAGDLLALPERLRAAVLSCLTREEVLGALESAWPAVEADVRAVVEGEIAERIEAMATEDLSPEPEAPAADRDPATVTVRWTCPRPSCGREHEWEWSEDDIPLGGAISRMHCESCPAVTPMVAHRVPGGVRMIEPEAQAAGEPRLGGFVCSGCGATGVITAVGPGWYETGPPPTAGELPAGWEDLRAVMNRAINELPDYRSGRVYGLVPKELVLGAVSAAIKPLWPTFPRPAFATEVEAAVREAIRSLHPCSCPDRAMPAEDRIGYDSSTGRVECHWGVGCSAEKGEATEDAVLAALRPLLASAPAEPAGFARRLRTDLALPPKETP